jgi:D-alanine-D-alanine ligase
MAEKLTVGILYGGRSVEHEISIQSAANVVANIEKERFDVVLLGIDKRGKWYWNERVDSHIDHGKSVAISLDALQPSILVLNSNESLRLDVVFPVLHGTDGEDGSIQGLFQALNVPVVGSGVLGSSTAMDKIVSKKILKSCGIRVADFVEFDRKDEGQIDFQQIVGRLGLPFMVKSSGLGSSVGVSMVKDASGFNKAIEEGFRYHAKVVIEQYIRGRELECAVMGNGSLQASFPAEIILSKGYDFYTYTAKYLDDQAVQIDLPARISEAATNKVRQAAMDAYVALQCQDFARVDLFLTDKEEVYVNEINTIPGFTRVSMFPAMWQHMGISYSQLISKLIDLCMERFRMANIHETDFRLPT